jgi:hypothetical protein
LYMFHTGSQKVLQASAFFSLLQLPS